MVILVDFLYDSALFGLVIHHDPWKLHDQLGILGRETSEKKKYQLHGVVFGFIKIVDGEFVPFIPPSFLHFSRAYIAGLAKVQAGAEIDHGPVTPLHLAARHGHLEACKASFFFFFRMDKLGGMNILLMVQKSGKNQWIWYSLSHYLQGFTVYIPGGWPWDFWLPSTVFWRGATIIEKVGHPKSLRVAETFVTWGITCWISLPAKILNGFPHIARWWFPRFFLFFNLRSHLTFFFALDWRKPTPCLRNSCRKRCPRVSFNCAKFLQLIESLSNLDLPEKNLAESSNTKRIILVVSFYIF